MKTFLLSVLSLALVRLAYSAGSPTLSPILIITGFAGSSLDVQDTSDTECNTNGKRIRTWINLTQIQSRPQCTISQYSLNYASNGSYSDPQEVQIFPANFGSVSSLNASTQFLPPSGNPEIVDYFLIRGYTRDVNIRAAPYDWRLGAEQLNERGYYSNLRSLVEQMYRENNNTKVTLVVISYGGPISLYFLTQVVDQEWKDMYIHAYVTLAAAWGVNSLIALITPPADSTFLFFPIEASVQDLLNVYRTWPGYYYLQSPPSVLGDTVIVETPTRNYTANDYEQLFTDAGYPEGYTRYNQSSLQFPAPNVSTFCFYGLGFPTRERYVYDDGFPATQPTVINGEGDQAANKANLEVCLQWANSGYHFNRTVFPGVSHGGILSDPTVLRSVGIVVGAPADPINNNGAAQLTSMTLMFYAMLLISVLLLSIN